MATERHDQHDPMLTLILEYKAGIEAYPAAVSQLSEDETDEDAADRTFVGPSNRIFQDRPVPTTLKGALAALRLADEEFGDVDSFGTTLLQCVIQYLEKLSRETVTT